MKEQTYTLALVEEIQQCLNKIREQLGTRADCEEEESQEAKIRRCILRLMDIEAPDHRGRMRRLFTQASHWQAIYRILVDYDLGAMNGDYIGFSSWMQRLVAGDDCRVPFSYDALRSISKTSFVRPFAKWRCDATYFQTRLPYEHMFRIAEAFLQLLKENGVVKG